LCGDFPPMPAQAGVDSEYFRRLSRACQPPSEGVTIFDARYRDRALKP
jgi:hypothetical protein